MAINRKDFLKSAGGLALLTILPKNVLGGPGKIAPSDQLTKGIIGVGGMGRGHYDYEGTRLTAVCDVDSSRLDAGVKAAKDKVKAYSDYRKLIEDPNVDIVHIATPPHWHGMMATEAANAGKDIWCEKPMTRTIGEGKRVMEAVKRNGNIFRLNTWFRFTDNFYGMGTTVKPIKKLVDSGLLGWPLTVTVSVHTGFNWKFYWIGKEHLEAQPIPKELDYDMWLGPAPYKPYNSHRVHSTFRGYWDYDGGGLGDMGQHYLDPVQYFLGKDDESPIRVEVDAPAQHHDAIGTWRQIIYTYADGCKIILNGDDYGDVNAPYIAGPKGNVYNGFRCDIPNIEQKLNEYPDPEPQNTNFSECVINRKKFALNEMNGFRSCTLVNMALVALRLGRNLNFDPKSLLFVDDDAANRLADQPHLTPWTTL
ncbi:MAG: Gfo/Idh/MocA family oxidoreductase [Rikenellaceae bacterium]